MSLKVCSDTPVLHTHDLICLKRLELSKLVGLVPDHRGLEVRGHGDRPLVPVDLHPGVCGGNFGALHAAAVPEL